MVGHPDHFADVSKMVSDPDSILPPELVPFPYFLLYVMRETGLIGPEDEPTRMQLLMADWMGRVHCASITVA
jgi:hypothetical protein